MDRRYKQIQGSDMWGKVGNRAWGVRQALGILDSGSHGIFYKIFKLRKNTDEKMK